MLLKLHFPGSLGPSILFSFSSGFVTWLPGCTMAEAEEQVKAVTAGRRKVVGGLRWSMWRCEAAGEQGRLTAGLAGSERPFREQRRGWDTCSWRTLQKAHLNPLQAIARRPPFFFFWRAVGVFLCDLCSVKFLLEGSVGSQGLTAYRRHKRWLEFWGQVTEI